MEPQIFDTLQLEFCPPLDTSLLAALLTDIQYDHNGATRIPSKDEVSQLRQTLRDLVASAEAEQLSEDFGDINISSSDDSYTTPDLLTTSESTISSESSINIDSPLHFLRAALPSIPLPVLRAHLDGQEDEVDMERVVDDLLAYEYMQEAEERGLNSLPAPEPQRQRKAPKKKGKQVMTLGDVRHRAQAQAVNNHANSDPPDPWTSISSISAYLASIIPGKSAAFFQSYFHSPKYTTPYNAVCAALMSAAPSSDGYNDVLFNLLDIVLPAYSEDHIGDVVADAELAVSATGGNADEALDLVHFLRSLDSESSGGPHHQPPSPVIPTTSAHHAKPASVSPLKSLPAQHKHPSESQNSMRRNKPSTYQWQAVPYRKTPVQPYEHASFIPAYSHNGGSRKAIYGNSTGKGGKGDVGELAYRNRVAENLRMRNEMVKEASRMWQRGNKKNRGGEIAFYFAERARQFQDQARIESLNAARSMVQAKMRNSQDKNTIDLHGLTSTEAITIVKEHLAQKAPTPAVPLTIITGRGSHSTNNVAVLKPAVHAALVRDGWKVSMKEAHLVVGGRI